VTDTTLKMTKKSFRIRVLCLFLFTNPKLPLLGPVFYFPSFVQCGPPADGYLL